MKVSSEIRKNRQSRHDRLLEKEEDRDLLDSVKKDETNGTTFRPEQRSNQSCAQSDHLTVFALLSCWIQARYSAPGGYIDITSAAELDVVWPST